MHLKYQCLKQEVNFEKCCSFSYNNKEVISYIYIHIYIYIYIIYTLMCVCKQTSIFVVFLLFHSHFDDAAVYIYSWKLNISDC